MHAIRFRAKWLLLGVLVATVASLWAQEAQIQSRSLSIINGNLTVSTGYIYSGAQVLRDYRTNTSLTDDANTTYTAAQVETGLITRGGTLSTPRTDSLPTAADLAAAMPGAIAGTSFWLVIDMDDPADTVTLNGASTGVTYGGGCAATLDTGDGMVVLITFTSTTAYRAVCLPGEE